MEVEPRGWFFKMWGGGMSASEIPDLICNVNGHFVGIEVKGKGGTPSVLQELNVERIKETNGYAEIIYPEDFEKLKKDVDKLLEM